MNKLLIPAVLLSFTVSQALMAEESATQPKSGRSNHFLKLFDSDGDGAVTEAEFKKVMQQRYQEMDADHNGTVSIEEFERYNEQRHKNFKQKKFAKLDSNHDGVVSKQEYMDRAAKRAERHFGKMDKNQDGQLSEQELSAKHKMKKRKLLKKMDKNQDGQITPEEHAEMTQHWFSRLDDNQDKVISGDELQGGRRGH